MHRRNQRCLFLPPPPNFQCVSRLARLTSRAALLAALFLGGNAALADGHGRGDFYVGGGLSSVRDKNICPVNHGAAAGVAPSGFAISTIPGNIASLKCEDKERGYKVFAGVRANENFGAELGYLAADGFASDTQAVFTSIPPGSISNGRLTVKKTDASLFYLAGVGYYPVSDDFSLLGKAGVHRWEKEHTVTFDAAINPAHDKFNVKVKEDGIGLLAGIGAQYDFAALPLSLRGEYEYARLDSSSSLRLLSFSILFRF